MGYPSVTPNPLVTPNPSVGPSRYTMSAWLVARSWRKRIATVLSVIILLTTLTAAQWSPTRNPTRVLARFTLPLGTKHAEPFQLMGRQVALNVMAGDAGLSAQSANRVATMIKSDAWPVLRNVFQGTALATARIILYSTPESYQRAVGQEFTDNASAIAARTGGFTVGTTIYIPLYKYHSQALLANTLAHEFTHVFLNVSGVSHVLPEWLNEGFAWTIGLAAENSVNQGATTSLLAGLDSQLQRARTSASLAPLTTRTATGLQKNFEYNLEYEDYLAVKGLEKTTGFSLMTQFLRNTPRSGVSASFQKTFGVTMKEYEDVFYRNLSRT